jgi:UDP-3-O-[3-hydroxymyristoyl] glucosamine N-acyltransferase
MFTLKELAELTRGRLVGNPAHLIRNIADLESASSDEASFLANPRYENVMRTSSAGVILVDSKVNTSDGRNYLIVEEPSRAFQTLIDTFFPHAKEGSGFMGVHPTAIVHPLAKVDPTVQIGPHAVIDQYAEVGKGSQIGAGSYIGSRVKIGIDCLLHPHVTIRERCILGNRVVIQPGAVIGSCGYGYATDQKGQHTKLNQVGIVVLEDDVEIGANTTIDRARFKETRIKRGTKIDNLVQIAHGVEVGEHNLIVAQAGIAGSTITGKHVILAGQTAIAGHIKLADGVIIAGKSGVSKSITKAGKYNGIPVMPVDQYNRNTVHLRNIGEYVEKIRQLSERVKELEQRKKDEG